MRSILASCIALTLATGCAAQWSSSTRPPTAETAAANTREVTGKVASYTTAQRGEMDGLVLDTGNRIHFPPHVGATLLPLIQKGDELRVIGTLADRPEGKVIEATSITNVARGRTVNVASVSPPPPPREVATTGGVRPPGQKQPTTTLTGAELTTKQGKVQGYTTAPTGDMDGVLLDSGARVHFPPQAGKAVLPLVQQGATIRVIGWELTGPEGSFVEATKIIATPSNQTVDIADVAQPRQPAVTPGAVAPPGKPPLESTTPQTTPPPASRVR